MKPFLLIATRPEDETAEAEYEQFLRAGELETRELHHLRLDKGPMEQHLDFHAYSGIMLGGSPFTGSIPQEHKSDTQVRVEHELGRLMDRMVEVDHPFLGACYGVGTLGTQQGARIDGTYAEEISAPWLRLTDEGRADPLLDGMAETFQAFIGHKEAITELPASATLMVTADLCPVQMFRVKDNLYGTQFHPELDEAGILQRIRVYRDAGYFDPAEQDRVEAQVRGVDARPAGLVIRNFVARYAR